MRRQTLSCCRRAIHYQSNAIGLYIHQDSRHQCILCSTNIHDWNIYFDATKIKINGKLLTALKKLKPQLILFKIQITKFVIKPKLTSQVFVPLLVFLWINKWCLVFLKGVTFLYNTFPLASMEDTRYVPKTCFLKNPRCAGPDGPELFRVISLQGPVTKKIFVTTRTYYSW